MYAPSIFVYLVFKVFVWATQDGSLSTMYIMF